MNPHPTGLGSRNAAVVTVLLLLALHPPVARLAQDTLPGALSDREFWSLIEQVSEPDGYFRSNSGSPDNLLSNEGTISTVAAALSERVKPGGVYLGVGPEQNFTYIAAMRPRLAFILDIRRGNLHLHLMYKALFELSATRADFVARLFSRHQPQGLTANPTAAELMDAYVRAEPVNEAGFAANLTAVFDHLTKTRALPLDADDRAGIEYVYRHFHRFGPDINYTSSINGRSGARGSYATIMASIDDATRAERTFLATADLFTYVRTLHRLNLIVPIVGNFAGPKALRAIGTYLRTRSATVSAFYVSNVENYLESSGVWPAFCANVATLPLDAASIFIRPGSARSGAFQPMAAAARGCAK